MTIELILQDEDSGLDVCTYTVNHKEKEQQYEANIAAASARLLQRSRYLIEKQNVRSVLAPLIPRARVLEVASGSGFYTMDLKMWGASDVLAVDISSDMIAEALKQKGSEEIRFLQADCSKPVMYPGSPFDLCFGAWLIDHATDVTIMENMFKTVAMNLKEGGVFVSVNSPPFHDIRSWFKEQQVARPDGTGGLHYSLIREMEGGIEMHVQGGKEFRDITYDVCAWDKLVYESAARAAGFTGACKWKAMRVPEEYMRGEVTLVEGETMEEVMSYADVPRYGIMVITK